MKILKLLLYPFAALYNLVTSARNYLYDIGRKPSFQFVTPVIAVGNLSVGGSGKTPMIEYLIELLKSQYGVATLAGDTNEIQRDTDLPRNMIQPGQSEMSRFNFLESLERR